MTIPISKLHTVARTLTNGRNGQVVNEGKLTLKFRDGAYLVSTKVGLEDNTFHFDFVPAQPGVMELPKTKDTTLREAIDTT